MTRGVHRRPARVDPDHELERAVRTGRASRLAFGPGEVLARLARHGDLFRREIEDGQRVVPEEGVAPAPPRG